MGFSRVTQFSAGNHSWARMERTHPGLLSPSPKLPVLYPHSPSFPTLKLSLAAWVPPSPWGPARAEEEHGVYVYDLMATVVHILDSRTGGSLVAHIKVGETYHQRKEVSEVIQGRDIPGGSHRGIPVLSLS